MSVHGTKRTCRGRLTISAPEGKTDVPRKPGHFRFWSHTGSRVSLMNARCHVAKLGRKTIKASRDFRDIPAAPCAGGVRRPITGYCSLLEIRMDFHSETTTRALGGRLVCT